MNVYAVLAGLCGLGLLLWALALGAICAVSGEDVFYKGEKDVSDIYEEIEAAEQIGAISMSMAGNVTSALIQRDSDLVRYREEIIRLNGNLDEWQKVGEKIQEATTGKPGQLSDSDVIGELERLRSDNALLHEANEKTYCAYCSAEYQRTDDALAQVREHISVCEFHPMRKLEAEIADLNLTLTQYQNIALNTLKRCGLEPGEYAHSYQNGMVMIEERVEALRAENKKLRDALEKYADEENWFAAERAKFKNRWTEWERGYTVARAALEPQP